MRGIVSKQHPIYCNKGVFQSKSTIISRQYVIITCTSLAYYSNSLFSIKKKKVYFWTLSCTPSHAEIREAAAPYHKIFFLLFFESEKCDDARCMFARQMVLEHLLCFSLFSIQRQVVLEYTKHYTVILILYAIYK